MLETLAQEGFRQLQPEYLQCWLHTDQQVPCSLMVLGCFEVCRHRQGLCGCGSQVVLQEGPPDAVHEAYLTIKGLADSGYMLAVDAGGERFELHPDGNRWAPVTI